MGPHRWTDWSVSSVFCGSLPALGTVVHLNSRLVRVRPSSVRGPTFGTAGIPRFPVAPVAVRGGSPGAWDRGVAVVAKPGRRAAAGARGAESCGQLVRVESTGAPVETWVRLMCWKDMLEGPWWTPKKAVFAKFFSFFLHLLLRVLGHQPAHSWTCDQLESASSIDFVPSSLALAGQLDKMFEMFRILTASRLPPFGHLLQPGQCPFPVTAMLFHLPNPLTDTLVMQHADCVPQHAEALGLTLVPIPTHVRPKPRGLRLRHRLRPGRGGAPGDGQRRAELHTAHARWAHRARQRAACTVAWA